MFISLLISFNCYEIEFWHRKIEIGGKFYFMDFFLLGTVNSTIFFVGIPCNFASFFFRENNLKNPTIEINLTVPISFYGKNSTKLQPKWCNGPIRFLDPPGPLTALASFPGSGNTWVL